MKIYKYLFIPLIFILSVISLLFLTTRYTQAAGFAWVNFGPAGGYDGCGSNNYARVTLRTYNGGGRIFGGFMEVFNNQTGATTSSANGYLEFACLSGSNTALFHANVAGYHEAWVPVGGWGKPDGTRYTNTILDINLYVLPSDFGPAISIEQPPSQWINYDPEWYIYAVPSPGHSHIGTIALQLYNQTTGAAPCWPCWFKGQFPPGTRNYGRLDLPDGWYSRGAQALDFPADGNVGATSWSEGKWWTDGVQWGSFGKDTQPATVISTSSDPVSPFSTDTVNILARAQDQVGLSGLDWIQIIYNVNGGAWSAPIQSPNYGGAFDQTFSTNIGRWPTGTTICYQARARDVAGNVSGWAGYKCFTVRAGADLEIESVTPLGDFHVGETISVTITVRNRGQQGAGAFWIEMCPSGNSPNINCPTSDTGTWTYRVRVNALAGNSPAPPATFTFPAPDPGVYPTTHTLVARVDLPSPGLVTEEVEYDNNWALEDYRVIGPWPWFQTTRGDVGSCGRINPRITPPVGFSADYLVIQKDDRTIRNFTSRLDWLVRDYNPLNIGPLNCPSVPGPASMYDALFEKYNVDPSNVLNSNNLNQLTAANRIFSKSSSLSIPASGVFYTQAPAVLFVSGDMIIDGDLIVGANTGIIFVVNGNVTIQQGVRRADGVYIFDGNYTVRSKGNNINPSNPENQLVVRGAVIGGFADGEFDLGRDFRSIANRTTPTERFMFEPKYLWLFRDIIGDKKTIWKEVAP